MFLTVIIVQNEKSWSQGAHEVCSSFFHPLIFLRQQQAESHPRRPFSSNSSLENQAVISGMVKCLYTVVCFFFFSSITAGDAFSVVFDENLRNLSDANVCVASCLSPFSFCKYWISFDQFDLEMECNFAYKKMLIKLLCLRCSNFLWAH